MKLEQSFEVQAPADRVWALITDLASVAPCLPGAELTDHDEDGSYEGTFTVKLGPTTASYRGRIHFEERDDEARRAVMHATGQDKRGQGGATATMITTVTGNGDRSHVSVGTDLLITGKLARFGRGGMIEDISNRLLADFASCLQAKLTGPEEVAEAVAEEEAVAVAEEEAVAVAEAPLAAPAVAPAPPVAPGPSAPPPAPPPGAAGDYAASAGPGPGPEQPAAANALSGATALLGTLPDLLRRNAQAVGGTVAAALLLVVWRRRRRRRAASVVGNVLSE